MNKSTIDFLNEKQVLVSPDLFDKEFDEGLIKKLIEEKNPEYLDENLIDTFLKDLNKKKSPSVKILKSYDKTPKKELFKILLMFLITGLKDCLRC